MNILLWVLQVLGALLYGVSGVNAVRQSRHWGFNLINPMNHIANSLNTQHLWHRITSCFTGRRLDRTRAAVNFS